MNDERQHGQSKARDWRRIADETKFEVIVEYLVAYVGRCGQEQGVTIRCRPNDGFGPNVAGGSRPVLDDKRPTELSGEPFGYEASVDVVRPASRKSDDHSHRP